MKTKATPKDPNFAAREAARRLEIARKVGHPTAPLEHNARLAMVPPRGKPSE